MTRTEHLLSILAEECAEVAQRVSKALRFGLDEAQPGQPLSNAARIQIEFHDLVAVYEMLKDAGAFPVTVTAQDVESHLDQKKEKVKRFLAYSAQCGTLQPEGEQDKCSHRYHGSSCVICGDGS